MKPQEEACTIYYGLYNMGFRFHDDSLEAIEAITNLIDEVEYDLKEVVIYVIKNYTK
jgi:hypothetical protein